MQRRAYVGMRAAAVRLQAAMRCSRLRQEFLRMRAAALIIQVVGNTHNCTVFLLLLCQTSLDAPQW